MANLRYIFLFCVVFLLNGCGKEEVFTSNWDEDIYVFAKTLEGEHKDLFHNISKVDFDSEIATLRESEALLDPSEIVIELLKILSKVGDSHTSMQTSPYLNSFPLTIEWLEDGMFISEIENTLEANISKKVLSINGVDINAITEMYRDIVTFENESQFKHQFRSFIRVPEILTHLGIIPSSDSLSLDLEAGENILVPMVNSGLSSFYQNGDLPLYLSDPTNYYWKEIIDDEDIMYVQYNRAANKTGEIFSSFAGSVLADLDNQLSLNKLVIDLRLNPGGNSAIMAPLIEGIEERINSGRLLKENVYVVIGRRTFSSALLNAFEMEERIDPVLIGEPTGGKLNHFGEVKSFRLPNSFLQVFYSSKYFELVDGDPDSLVPDVEVLLSSHEFFGNLDPVLEYVKNN